MEIKILKKKLLYSSTHRGCKEMDILLGSFVKEYLDNLSESELSAYTEILEFSDAVLYKFFTRKRKFDTEKNAAMLEKITNHCYGKKIL